MPHINYSQKATQDLARLVDFIQTVAPQTKDKMIDTLQNSISNLTVFPELGKPSRIKGMRELFIPFGKNSYMVLYYYTKQDDSVDIVSIKHSRELKYSVE